MVKALTVGRLYRSGITPRCVQQMVEESDGLLEGARVCRSRSEI